MAKNGSAILIAVNTGTEGSPTYTAIPCQTSAEYALSVDAIDTSCKDSADETNIAGSRSRSISAETNVSDWPEFALSPTGAEQIVRNAAETGAQVQGAVVVDGDPAETFTATITSLSVSAPREDTTTMSLELQISGGMTPAGS